MLKFKGSRDEIRALFQALSQTLWEEEMSFYVITSIPWPVEWPPTIDMTVNRLKSVV